VVAIFAVSEKEDVRRGSARIARDDGLVLFCMWKHWGDDLGWILYIPNLCVGLLAAIIISEIARRANQWIHGMV